MPKPKHEQLDLAGLEIVADEFTGTFNGSVAGALASVTALTDNSTGTSGGNTIGAVSDVATTANAIATLAAKINAIIAALD
jgi:hypothetical protein